jgi:hypothetical protein
MAKAEAAATTTKFREDIIFNVANMTRVQMIDGDQIMERTNSVVRSLSSFSLAAER